MSLGDDARPAAPRRAAGLASIRLSPSDRAPARPGPVRVGGTPQRVRPDGGTRTRRADEAATSGSRRFFVILAGVSDPPIDESALLAAWRAGDAQAGQALFRRHYAGLTRFFCSKAGDAAFELTQATFLACVEARTAIRTSVSFPAYLYGVARNILFEHYRRKSRSKDDLDFAEVSCEDLSPGLAGVQAREQELDLLLRAMRKIPIDAQILLELYYWERMTAREIAEVLAVPEGTVRTRIRDAKQHVEAHVARLARTPELAESTVIGFETWAGRLRGLVARQ